MDHGLLTVMSQRILIINIFGIGDVLFTTPMLRNIRENIPGAFIGYVCNKRALGVLENNPHISKIHIYEKDDFSALARQSRIKSFKKFVRFLADIKKEKYDLVFDLSLHKYGSFLLWLVGIKERVGFNYKNRSPFLTARVNTKGYEAKHVVEHYLSLLEFSSFVQPMEKKTRKQSEKSAHGLSERISGSGGAVKDFRITSRKMEVFIKEEDRRLADALLERNGIGGSQTVIALIPGGGASWGADARYRRWAPEKHAHLADKIIEKYQTKIILLGDSSEKDLGREVAGHMRQKAVNLTGQTTLGVYLALLSRCALVILNDGGPLHMAVAAGTRTVSLIGPVNENVYGPYPKDGHQIVTKDIACRPCYRHFRRADCGHIECLNGVSVEDFFEKVQENLSALHIQKGGRQ